MEVPCSHALQCCPRSLGAPTLSSFSQRCYVILERHLQVHHMETKADRVFADSIVAVSRACAPVGAPGHLLSWWMCYEDVARLVHVEVLLEGCCNSTADGTRVRLQILQLEGLGNPFEVTNDVVQLCVGLPNCRREETREKVSKGRDSGLEEKGPWRGICEWVKLTVHQAPV